MRVSDRNLLVDEIERKLKEELPDKNTIILEVTKEKELQYQIDDIKATYRKYKAHQARMKTAEETMNSILLDFRKSIGNDSKYLGYTGGDKHEQLLNEIYDYGKNKYKIPSRQEIETAILFAGEKDMIKLLNKVLKQFKK